MGGTARSALLAEVTAAAFLAFGQAFMVAPILPQLATAFATAFGTGVGTMGLSVPAYLIPYGLMTLFWGPLSDRTGRRPVILGSRLVFAGLTTAGPWSAGPPVLALRRHGRRHRRWFHGWGAR